MYTYITSYNIGAARLRLMIMRAGGETNVKCLYNICIYIYIHTHIYIYIYITYYIYIYICVYMFVN